MQNYLQGGKKTRKKNVQASLDMHTINMNPSNTAYISKSADNQSDFSSKVR